MELSKRNFRQFIENKAWDLDWRLSWLDPQGNFHPLGFTDTHGLYAREQFNKTLDEMFQAGWHRIAYVGTYIYAHNNRMPPNYKQTKALTNAAIESQKYEKIYYDNEYQDRLIWTIDEE